MLSDPAVKPLVETTCGAELGTSPGNEAATDRWNEWRALIVPPKVHVERPLTFGVHRGSFRSVERLQVQVGNPKYNHPSWFLRSNA